MSSIPDEFENIRRILERGKNKALEDLDEDYLDIFQHALDLWQRTKNQMLEAPNGQ